MSDRKEKFTPAPWSVRDKICIFRFLSVTSDKSPFVIAKIMQPDMQRILEGATKGKADWEQLSANAALIAAAPEMYEELEKVASFLRNAAKWIESQHGIIVIGATMQYAADNIDKLLEKARGEVKP